MEDIMAYKLTLTETERDAFDWVGARYSNGDDMRRIFCEYLPEGMDWCQPGDITFDLPEHAAWQIKELSEKDDNLFPCFSPDLVTKMLIQFLDKIV
jgi:hypothetical protein